MERQQNLEKKQYEAESKYQQKEQELLQQIHKKVSDAVKEVSEKEGYDYVFDLGAVLYAGGENIEGLVRKKLGLSTE
jgi:Skp family chaperone for outer membrane proteins